MSVEEFHQWVAYYRRRGTLNPNRKLEWGFGMIAAQINNAAGGKKTPADYMPYLEDPDDEMTLQEAMGTWN